MNDLQALRASASFVSHPVPAGGLPVASSPMLLASQAAASQAVTSQAVTSQAVTSPGPSAPEKKPSTRQRVAQPVAQPVAKSPTQPIAKSVAQPLAQPMAQPMATPPVAIQPGTTQPVTNQAVRQKLPAKQKSPKGVKTATKVMAKDRVVVSTDSAVAAIAPDSPEPAQTPKATVSYRQVWAAQQQKAQLQAQVVEFNQRSPRHSPASLEQWLNQARPLSVSNRPTADRPAPHRPITGQPIADRPVTNQPIANQPIADQPVTNRPVANQPIANRPIADRPVTNRPVANRPMDSSQPVHSYRPEPVVQPLPPQSTEDPQASSEIAQALRNLVGRHAAPTQLEPATALGAASIPVRGAAIPVRGAAAAPSSPYPPAGSIFPGYGASAQPTANPSAPARSPSREDWGDFEGAMAAGMTPSRLRRTRPNWRRATSLTLIGILLRSLLRLLLGIFPGLTWVVGGILAVLFGGLVYWMWRSHRLIVLYRLFPLLVGLWLGGRF
jgi:hypothetical protein